MKKRQRAQAEAKRAADEARVQATLEQAPIGRSRVPAPSDNRSYRVVDPWNLNDLNDHDDNYAYSDIIHHQHDVDDDDYRQQQYEQGYDMPHDHQQRQYHHRHHHQQQQQHAIMNSNPSSRSRSRPHIPSLALPDSLAPPVLVAEENFAVKSDRGSTALSTVSSPLRPIRCRNRNRIKQARVPQTLSPIYDKNSSHRQNLVTPKPQVSRNILGLSLSVEENRLMESLARLDSKLQNHINARHERLQESQYQHNHKYPQPSFNDDYSITTSRTTHTHQHIARSAMPPQYNHHDKHLLSPSPSATGPPSPSSIYSAPIHARRPRRGGGWRLAFPNNAIPKPVKGNQLPALRGLRHHRKVNYKHMQR
jgi:hypothetical protein